MNYNEDYLSRLVEQPQESLSTEIKRWLDPTQDEHLAKIVKTCIALRNHDGGCLVIGFDNETANPDRNNVLSDVRATYHIDIIQGSVAKYSSEPFEVEVRFIEREGQEYPIICVPSGVRTPVATKRSLLAADGRTILIKQNQVYVRSLDSNNTPSTTEATWKDWGAILEVCFNNRESDIGRFIRRNLTEETIQQISEYLTNLGAEKSPDPDSEEQFYSYCNARFQTRTEEAQLSLPETGFFEVSALIIGEVPEFEPNRSFYRLLASNNPRHTGWPLWLDSTGFIDRASEPRVVDNGWEALIVSIGERDWDHIDFWRIEPQGRFYHRRAFEVDLPPSPFKPLAVFDFAIATKRVAEAISVIMAFAKAMRCNPENTSLGFSFRWTKLSDRVQEYWSDHELLSYGVRAYQDELLSKAIVPLDIMPTTIFTFVHKICKPLFHIFDGAELPPVDSERLTNELLRQRY